MPTTTAMTNTLESALINLVLNGTGYSSLNSTDKKIVFKYLDALTKECLLQYDILYNL